jgi:hypothetical protein
MSIIHIGHRPFVAGEEGRVATAESELSDRVIDVGRSHAPSGRNDLGVQWRKLVAFAVVAIMVTSAFVLLMPSAPKKVLVPDNQSPVKSEVGGATRKVVYEVSRIGESYMKPTDYSKLGRHDHNVIGVNDWFAARLTTYNDTIVHNSYPCIVAYTPYSDRLAKPVKYNLASFTIHSYYQLKVDAENITELATGANKDPWILPIMGSVASDGG